MGRGGTSSPRWKGAKPELQTVRDITEIFIHCSATREGQDIDAATIDQWHKDRGWSGIGYHYVIKLDGTIEKGRSDIKIGAHAQGHNRRSIGVCYIGGLTSNGQDAKDTRTPDQLESMTRLITELTKLYPNAKVRGHNEVAAKACPSFDVGEWWYGDT